MGYIKIIDFGHVKEIKERITINIGKHHIIWHLKLFKELIKFLKLIYSQLLFVLWILLWKLPFGEEYDEPMDIYKVFNKE